MLTFAILVSPPLRPLSIVELAHGSRSRLVLKPFEMGTPLRLGHVFIYLLVVHGVIITDASIVVVVGSMFCGAPDWLLVGQLLVCSSSTLVAISS